MAKRTYFSRHIPSGSMDSKQVEAVLSDIDTFNRIMHKAAASQYVKNHSDRREKAAVDRRKKENRHLITETSFHCLVKEEYGVDDHFANSAVNEAKASIQSVKELNKLNIDECTSQLRDLKKKRSDVRRTLTRLKKIKNVLILASKKKAAGKESFCTLRGPIEKYDRETGSFRIMKGEKVLRVYENPYLFEVRYVDPKIRRCKNIISQLDRRETRLNDRIARMKNKLPGICFGSKKFFARQYDKKRYPDHSVWLNVFRKKRSHALMISGRKDASQGNYRFRYDSLKHELTYISQSGMHIIFPDVEFPRGQDAVNHAVNAKKEERKPVAWRIIRTGGSFLIQCIITVKEVEYSNYYYRNGCIAMDTNYDNFSVCEIDGSGNLLSHRIIPFDLEKASSGHAEQILSAALDKVFALCTKSKKPLAMENLKLKHTASRYGGKRRNFVTSRFAFSKVTALVDSKSIKYNVDVKKVNPAYTSQMGKLLFVKKYGLTIHEAASIAIGRRALGYTDRLPDVIRAMLPKEKQELEGLDLWKAAYPVTKKMQAKDMYGYRFCTYSAC